MAGLKHTLNVGSESLFASRQGVDTTGHNIANAHTEGFSRQRVNLETRVPSQSRGVVIGNGVFVKSIDRAHDKFLEKQLNFSNMKKGYSEGKLDSMKPLENIFSPELNTTVADQLNNFFGSLQNLSNFPEELAVRSSVRESAIDLTSSFQSVNTSLKTHRVDINERLLGESQSVNKILQGIANLNSSLKHLETSSDHEVSDLLDQQDKFLRELTTKMDVNYYRDEYGMLVVHGPGEALLVENSLTAEVKLSKNPDNAGMYDILIDRGSSYKPVNITKLVKAGKISGMVEIRDKTIPKLRLENNTLAQKIASELNHWHKQAYGIREFSEKEGRDFFSISADLDTAAETINISDQISLNTDAISVASTPNAPGDNVFVNEMLRLREKKIMNDNTATFSEFYASGIGSFGLELVRTENLNKANEVVSNDINSRKEAISGVSMDEEAINLLKWQANFTASSKVITTVDEMMETVLGMKR